MWFAVVLFVCDIFYCSSCSSGYDLALQSALYCTPYLSFSISKYLSWCEMSWIWTTESWICIYNLWALPVIICISSVPLILSLYKPLYPTRELVTKVGNECNICKPCTYFEMAPLSFLSPQDHKKHPRAFQNDCFFSFKCVTKDLS